MNWTLSMNNFKNLVAVGTFALALATAPALADTVSVGSMAVEVPDNWYITTIPEDEIDTRQILVSNDKAADQAIMMVSVVPRDGRSLSQISSDTRKYITSADMDGVIEDERSTKVDGAPAYLFLYEGRSEHEQQGRRKFMRVVVERGNEFYVLHGVADHVPFANYAGVMRNIINSAKWK